MDGLLLRLCVRNPDGGLRYIDVQETEEQWPALSTSACTRPPTPRSTVGVPLSSRR